MWPALPSARTCSNGTGEPQQMHRRRDGSPFPARLILAGAHLKAHSTLLRLNLRRPPSPRSLQRMRSFPALTRARTTAQGACGAPQAGLGHRTVRAQIQAMTVSSCSRYSFKSGRSLAISAGDLHFRIQVSDTLLGLIAHPLPVIAHVVGQPLGSLPLNYGLFLTLLFASRD